MTVSYHLLSFTLFCREKLRALMTTTATTTRPTSPTTLYRTHHKELGGVYLDRFYDRSVVFGYNISSLTPVTEAVAMNHSNLSSFH